MNWEQIESIPHLPEITFFVVMAGLAVAYHYYILAMDNNSVRNHLASKQRRMLFKEWSRGKLFEVRIGRERNARSYRVVSLDSEGTVWESLIDVGGLEGVKIIDEQMISEPMGGIRKVLEHRIEELTTENKMLQMQLDALKPERENEPSTSMPSDDTYSW